MTLINNEYRSRKITRSNKLFGYLKYQVIISGTKNYIKMRSWCLKTFGESVEYSLFKHIDYLNINPAWSWDTENDQHFKRFIYLKDDYELQLFENNFELVTKS
jgi:hypothetical protein